MEETTMYNILRGNENYKKHLEKKGNFSYISWSYCWDKVKEVFPYAEYKQKDYKLIKDGNEYTVPCQFLPNGTALVTCQINLTSPDGDEHKFEETLAVTDNSNRAVVNPDAVQIVNTFRRALAKGVSMQTGLGIELWAGEDIRDLDYKKEVHPTGDEIVEGMATGVQSRKIERLKRDAKITGPIKKSLEDTHKEGYKITEAHAQILIEDAKANIAENKAIAKIQAKMEKDAIKITDKSKAKKLTDWLKAERTLVDLKNMETKIKDMI